MFFGYPKSIPSPLRIQMLAACVLFARRGLIVFPFSKEYVKKKHLHNVQRHFHQMVIESNYQFVFTTNLWMLQLQYPLGISPLNNSRKC